MDTDQEARQLATEILFEVRTRLAGLPPAEWKAQLEIALFALERGILRGESGGRALGILATAARDALAQPGMEPATSGEIDPDLPGSDWTNVNELGVGVDELTHRRFLFERVRDLLLLDAQLKKEKKAGLPSMYMAHAVSRMLGQGPLAAWYVSKSRWAMDPTVPPDKRRLIEGDAPRIEKAWGYLDTTGSAEARACRMLTKALVGLGVDAKRSNGAFVSSDFEKKRKTGRARK